MTCSSRFYFLAVLVSGVMAFSHYAGATPMATATLFVLLSIVGAMFWLDDSL